MIAQDIVSNEIPVLKGSDSVQKALSLMSDLNVEQLPFVENNEFLSFFSEDFLFNFDDDTLLSDIPMNQTLAIVGQNAHLYEILAVFTKQDFNMLAVVSDSNLFQGIILKANFLEVFINKLGFNEQGAILEISLKNKDYSLAEISRLIETENLKIISTYLTGDTTDLNNDLKLLLKLNKREISNIVNSLTRFGYEVLAFYNTEPVESLEKERFDQLMRYLNI
jgi:acetoin utilization protein AcuB